MTVDNESKVFAMHKKSRVELACAIMTIESESKVCAMHKTSRIRKQSCAKMRTNDSQE